MPETASVRQFPDAGKNLLQPVFGAGQFRLFVVDNLFRCLGDKLLVVLLARDL